MKKNTNCSNRVGLTLTVTIIIFFILFLFTSLFYTSNVSLLYLSFFLALLEARLLFLFLNPNRSICNVLKNNVIIDKQTMFLYVVLFFSFIAIGGVLSIWCAMNLYKEMNIILNGYRMGIFSDYHQGKPSAWITYNLNTDPVGFKVQIIYRFFWACLWAFPLKLGVVIIILAFRMIIKLSMRKI
ncbi:hypothetical protein J2T04_003914 [Chryseobacterium lathyri]|uniref:DUF2953 domain-containing protein n=1 Tax=Chryseobacterium lathyri TaxID=395933 RepID=A0ABT9SRB6_9FLAO|nr:hypothetical protein [Chryseobacterium lathyri]